MCFSFSSWLYFLLPHKISTFVISIICSFLLPVIYPLYDNLLLNFKLEPISSLSWMSSLCMLLLYYFVMQEWWTNNFQLHEKLSVRIDQSLPGVLTNICYLGCKFSYCILYFWSHLWKVLFIKKPHKMWLHKVGM